MAGNRWNMLTQMIKDYKDKYYRDFSMYILRETTEVTIENVSKAISFLKPKIFNYYRLVELLAYLYQVIQLEMNSDMTRFGRESRIEYLA